MVHKTTREFLMGDRESTVSNALKLGTKVAQVFALVPEIATGPQALLALLAMAHREDAQAADDPTSVDQLHYPEEIAVATGLAKTTANIEMNRLAAKGVIEGSTRGGYRFAGPLKAGATEWETST